MSRLRELRVHVGLSSRELAALAGLPASTLLKIERGSETLPVNQRKIEAALGVALDRHASAMLAPLYAEQAVATAELDAARQRLERADAAVEVGVEDQRRELEQLREQVAGLWDDASESVTDGEAAVVAA